MKRYSTLNMALVAFLLTGCTTEFGSFQSSQLTFVRDQLRSNSDRDGGPRPEWLIHWLGEERPVYAVNAGSQVLFANESGDLLRFYDNQIVEARNLLPGQRTVLIDRNKADLRYRINGDFVGIHTCRAWELERVEKKPDSTTFIQRCSNGKTMYANRFSINQDRQLVQLIYYVHPEYPVVRLELAL